MISIIANRSYQEDNEFEVERRFVLPIWQCINRKIIRIWRDWLILGYFGLGSSADKLIWYIAFVELFTTLFSPQTIYQFHRTKIVRIYIRGKK